MKSTCSCTHIFVVCGISRLAYRFPMALTREKKDQAHDHLKNCQSALLDVASLGRGVVDGEVSQIQALILKIAEKIERAPER